MEMRAARLSLRSRAAVATIAAFSLLLTSAGVPVLAQETANFMGTILDPDGRPAGGFQVVMKDVVSGREFTSAPSGADGKYSLSVPVGGRYTLARVLAPDGSPLPVQSIPPLAVQTSGTNRLDVAFQRTAPPASPAEQAKVQEPEEKDDRGVPWYKTKGGITGIVLGAAAVAALAIGGGDDDEPSPPPSPSGR